MSEEVKTQLKNLIVTNEKCLKDFCNNNMPINLVAESQEDKFVLGKVLHWYKKYQTKPDLGMIFKNMKEENLDNAVLFKSKIAEWKKTEAVESNYPYLLEKIRFQWGNERLMESLENAVLTDKAKISSTEDLSKLVRKIGSDLAKIDGEIATNSSGYSFTTKEADEKIEDIKNRDLTLEKRFKVGHDALDDVTGGFRYGEVFIILGNVNQGKSFTVINMAYNLWLNGANVLLFTAEMQPAQFEERLYSRASVVSYNKIMSGKEYIQEDDIRALDQAVKKLKSKPNQIVTKWLDSTDNVNTIQTYLDELEKVHDFVPDVLIVDSFECLSPVEKKEKDWENKGQIVIEFKDFAEKYKNNRGVVVISTHQAKTGTLEKEFKDIDIDDIGRSKIVAEKADAAVYQRYQSDLKMMNVKAIKGRRFDRNLSWSMQCDFSKAMITNIENDTTNSDILGE